MKEYKRIITLMESEGWNNNGDDFFQHPETKHMIVIWEFGIRFYSIPLKQVKELIKRWEIQRVIDEDNCNGIMQSIWSLYHGELEYKIILSQETRYDNHSTDDTIKAVSGMLGDIQKGKRTASEILDMIDK